MKWIAVPQLEVRCTETRCALEPQGLICNVVPMNIPGTGERVFIDVPPMVEIGGQDLAAEVFLDCRYAVVRTIDCLFFF